MDVRRLVTVVGVTVAGLGLRRGLGRARGGQGTDRIDDRLPRGRAARGPREQRRDDALAGAR